MTPEIELRRVDEIPADSRVCHCDELEPSAKERLGGLVGRDAPSVEEEVADGFGPCEVVKFTDYYEITVTRSDSVK